MSTVFLPHCRIREKKDWTVWEAELTGTQVSLVGENRSMGNDGQLKVLLRKGSLPICLSVKFSIIL